MNLVYIYIGYTYQHGGKPMACFNHAGAVGPDANIGGGYYSRNVKEEPVKKEVENNQPVQPWQSIAEKPRIPIG